jgi:hypothetical protein
MSPLRERFSWGLREAAWKIDEKVVWPVADAVDRLGDGGVEPETRPTDGGRGRWSRYWPDVLLAAVLAVVAVLSRRHGLPTDGLWQDDAADGAATFKAPLSQLILVGKDHPGYLAILKGWSEVTGGGTDSLATPAFIAGVLGPPLLYLGLQALRFARSISFLLGAALAAAQTHIVNSGRLRTFTIDVLVVLALAVILPRLARIRWTWATAVVWFVGAVLVASVSGFALGAVLAAGAIILLHRNSDLVVRAVAVGAQFAATIALYADEARNYSSATIENYYRELWDAFPDFHLNPISFGGELLLHLRRLAEAFPAGPTWFAMVCGLVAVAGLAAACLPGRRAVAARFLALVLVATVVASLFGKVPFGPKQSSALDNGYRTSLWLIPVVAFGLAMALQAARHLLVNRRMLRIGFDAAVFAAAAAVLVSAGPALRYPFPGPRSAANYIDANLGAGDAVILPFHTQWSFAAESRFQVKMVSAPEFTVSFDPVGWSDPRIHYIDQNVDRSQVAAAVKGANRVFVYYPALKTLGLVPHETQTRSQLTRMLGSMGLKLQHSVSYQDDNAAVDVLGHRVGQVNLQLSDFPPGWRLSAPNAVLGERLLTCAGLAARGSTASVVVATGPQALNAISQLNQWRTKAAASRAASALRPPAGAACVRSVVERSLAEASLPFNVTVRATRPPPAAGRDAAAYRVTASSGGTKVAEGLGLFFRHGRTTALMGGIRGETNRTFPRALLATLAAKVAKRISAPSP